MPAVLTACMLRFRFAAVFQKCRVEPEAADRADDIRRRDFADETAKSAESGLRQIRLRRLTGLVSERDVRDFVRERSGKLAFTARGFNRPASDVDRPAGERERVHLGNVDDFEAVRVALAGRARDQFLAEAVDIFIQSGVGE